MKKKNKYGGIAIWWLLISASWAQLEVDPTVCYPLGDCLTMCQRHEGNEYADFAIPGKECICPACNTIKNGRVVRTPS